MIFPEKLPAVVGSIITPAGLRLLARAKLPCDVAEVRVDALLAQGAPVEKIEAALKARKHPVLLTLRVPKEGGQRAWKLAERRELYLRLLPWVEGIDVELATAPAMRLVLEAAVVVRVTTVLSAHHLRKPATAAQLARHLADFPRAPGTILKIASLIKSWHDLQRLAALLVDHPALPLTVMGVGPHAGQSRSVLAALGSRLVYGYLDAPAAPGQPAAAQVREMLAALPPR